MPSWVFARKGKRETPEIKARFVGRKFVEETEVTEKFLLAPQNSLLVDAC